MSTVFEKIISREIPAEFVHEDDFCVAVRDVDPQAPHHLLVIPKKVIARVGDVEPDDQALLGHLLLAVGKVAEKEGLKKNGFRVVINHGKNGGESVPHLHLHLLGGRQMNWPPG